MEELLKIGQKFLDDEKNYVHREIEFQAKLESLPRKQTSSSTETQQVVPHILNTPKIEPPLDIEKELGKNVPLKLHLILVNIQFWTIKKKKNSKIIFFLKLTETLTLIMSP